MGFNIIGITSIKKYGAGRVTCPWVDDLHCLLEIVFFFLGLRLRQKFVEVLLVQDCLFFALA